MYRSELFIKSLVDYIKFDNEAQREEFSSTARAGAISFIVDKLDQEFGLNLDPDMHYEDILLELNDAVKGIDPEKLELKINEAINEHIGELVGKLLEEDVLKEEDLAEIEREFERLVNDFQASQKLKSDLAQSESNAKSVLEGLAADK